MTLRKLHPHFRRDKRLGHFARRALTVLLLIVIGYGLIRLGLAGRSSSWPLADCSAIASRVVPGGIWTTSLFRRPLIYIGEFQLRYMVEGREYLLWAHSGWYDADQNFIQQRVAALPATCPNRIRYNPQHPAEALAVSRETPPPSPGIRQYLIFVGAALAGTLVMLLGIILAVRHGISTLRRTDA